MAWRIAPHRTGFRLTTNSRKRFRVRAPLVGAVLDCTKAEGRLAQRASSLRQNTLSTPRRPLHRSVAVPLYAVLCINCSAAALLRFALLCFALLCFAFIPSPISDSSRSVRVVTGKLAVCQATDGRGATSQERSPTKAKSRNIE